MTSPNQVVVFDIWSSYGYFRRPYTTTTALTFNFIPRTAIQGVIGAILGINSKDLFLELDNSKIGLGIINEIRKIPFSTMHIHSDFWQEMRAYIDSKAIKKKNYHTRVNIELLVNPKYRIYFSDTKYFEQIATSLINHHTMFTPYLGTSTMIANFAYVDTFNYHVKREEISEISSIIPYSNKIPNVVIEKDKFYAMEQNIPARINQDRELLLSYSALYSPKGQTIKIRDLEVNSFNYNGREHNFVFLPS